MRARASVAVALLVLLLAPRGAAAEADDVELQHALDRIRSSPREAEGFGELAAWLFRRGDVGRAHQAAREAARLEPESARYQRLLGYVAAAGHDSSEAERALQRAAEIDPAARASLADFHLAQAWAGYQEALRRNGPDPAVLERLREIAAAAEISPEAKAMTTGRWSAPIAARESVPPIYLAPGVDTALIVEKRTQTVRLYGRSESGVALLQTYPCTTGQAEGAKQERGDLKTPDGVYFFSDLLSGERLPKQYGAAALPLRYPNAWDRRAGRSGHGIWFHGSDRLASPFTPRDTQGCVLMRNDDLVEVASLVTPLTTPVLIAEEVPDLPAADWQALLARLGGSESATAVIAAPEYVLVLHRQGETAAYDFIPRSGERLHEELALVPASTWDEKLRALRPETIAALASVRIADDRSGILIETTAPVKARLFRPELSRRVYLDLPGVRSAPVPEVRDGSGIVERLRIAPISLDPPLTRIVVDLAGDAPLRLDNEGTLLRLSFAEARTR